MLTFQQDVDGYAGTSDKEIRSDNNDAANGDASEISVDGDDGGGPTHGLIRFANVFGPADGQVPVGTDIASATLTLNITSVGSPLQFHRMLVDWNEADTWATFGGDGITPGIDAAAEPAFTTPFISPTGAYDFDVTAIYRDFADGLDDYGIGLIPTGTNGVDFTSSEPFFLDADLAPILTIVVPEPAAATLLGVAGLAALRRRRA